MSDTLDLVGKWLNDVIAGPIPSAKVLNHTEQQEEIRRNVPFQPRTPISSAALAQQEQDEERREREMELDAYTQPQNSAHLAGLNERNGADAHPLAVPEGRKFDHLGEDDSTVIVSEELKNAARIIRQNLANGSLTPERLKEFYLHDPKGQQLLKYQHALGTKFGERSSGAEFEMMPVVHPTDEERARSQNNKVLNMEALRLQGIEGAALQDVSGLSPGATRQMAPRGRADGPTRVTNPSVNDMAQDSGNWPKRR